MTPMHFMAKELYKLAQLPEPPPDSGEPPPPEQQGSTSHTSKPWVHAAKAVGSGLLGFGVGTAAGVGVQHGIEKAFGPGFTPAKARMMAPLLGGGMGLAYNLYKAKEQEALHRALKSHQNQRAASSPAE